MPLPHPERITGAASRVGPTQGAVLGAPPAPSHATAEGSETREGTTLPEAPPGARERAASERRSVWLGGPSSFTTSCGSRGPGRNDLACFPSPVTGKSLRTRGTPGRLRNRLKCAPQDRAGRERHQVEADTSSHPGSVTAGGWDREATSGPGFQSGGGGFLRGPGWERALRVAKSTSKTEQDWGGGGTRDEAAPSRAEHPPAPAWPGPPLTEEPLFFVAPVPPFPRPQRRG